MNQHSGCGVMLQLSGLRNPRAWSFKLCRCQIRKDRQGSGLMAKYIRVDITRLSNSFFEYGFSELSCTSMILETLTNVSECVLDPHALLNFTILNLSLPQPAHPLLPFNIIRVLVICAISRLHIYFLHAQPSAGHICDILLVRKPQGHSLCSQKASNNLVAVLEASASFRYTDKPNPTSTPRPDGIRQSKSVIAAAASSISTRQYVVDVLCRRRPTMGGASLSARLSSSKQLFLLEGRKWVRHYHQCLKLSIGYVLYMRSDWLGMPFVLQIRLVRYVLILISIES